MHRTTKQLAAVGAAAVIAAVCAGCGGGSPPTRYNGGVPTARTTTPAVSPPPTTTKPPARTTTTTKPPLTISPSSPPATAAVPQPAGFVLRTSTPKQAATPGTPEWVATQFVAAAESMSSRWNDPYQWVYGVRNYVAPSYWPTLFSTAQAAVTPTEWKTIVETDAGDWVEPLTSVDLSGSLSGPTNKPGATTANVVVRYKLGKLVGPTTSHAQPGTLVRSVVIPMTLRRGTWYVSGPATPDYGT